MAEINSPSDATVQQMQRDHIALREKINALIAGMGQQSVDQERRVELGKVTSLLTGEENTREVLSQQAEFDQDTEGREVATLTDGYRRERNMNAIGGFSFPTDDIVWSLRINNDAFAQLMRVEGQVWWGTTTSTIPVGGSGTVDMVTASGTESRSADDWFGEEIGSGVKVVGGYAPDGKNYIFAAACEQESTYEEGSGSGNVQGTGTFVLIPPP